MNARKLIADVEAAGGSLHFVQPDRLKVTAPRPLSAGLVEQVRQSKTAIIQALVNPPFDLGDYGERAAIIESNGMPREWAEGFATLCTIPPPALFNPDRWRQIVDDGGHFLDLWGRQAALLGWKALDVFGVNPAAPESRYDSMGLVPLLNGRRVSAITADTARIERGGTFYRQNMNANSIAIWKWGKHE